LCEKAFLFDEARDDYVADEDDQHRQQQVDDEDHERERTMIPMRIPTVVTEARVRSPGRWSPDGGGSVPMTMPGWVAYISRQLGESSSRVLRVPGGSLKARRRAAGGETPPGEFRGRIQRRRSA
jgi:hypothetical protein